MIDISAPCPATPAAARARRESVVTTSTARSWPSRRAAHTQHAGFGIRVEPVAGLDLDRGDAFADQRIEARQALGDKFVLGSGARRLDGRHDAAACAR